MLHDGLYEQIINKGLETELSTTDKLSTTAPIDSAEASKVLAKYIAEVVEKGLDNVADNGGDVSSQVALANRIISTIIHETKENELDEMTVTERAEQLLALFDKKNSILSLDEKAAIIRPETSIAQSSLFTGAIHEPQMFTELKKEIISCNRIDMLVSFIKWSGLRLIMDELTTFTQNGGELRIITTSYMGATDVKAIEELRKLPNTKIKVSYDTKRTRLHAKTYVFYRDTGFTTAYVGSSNLSNAAISSGLEWNVKVTKKDLPETIDKIEATFESYWNSNEFGYYNEDQKERLARALKSEKYFDSNNAEVYTMDITPYSYQQEILDKLEAERKVRGYHRNLVVAATGTGKTVISALDYKRFRKQNPDKPCRFLFVAHREEILKQSMYTFRAVLKDANFGEMFVGSYKPESIDNLFISIQTFNSQSFTEKTTSDFYDYIIVDEFHHAAAHTLLDGELKEETTINWNKRPDLVFASDHTVSATCTEEIDDNGISCVDKILIIELKKGGFQIGKSEIYQAEGYVESIYKGNKLNAKPRIKAYVIGDSVDSSTSIHKTQEDFGEVFAYTYDQLVRTAEKRLFHLKAKLEEHYNQFNSEDYVNTILNEPEQLRLNNL